MGRIPEELIQQVMAATDIVELIGRYVKLKRAGSEFVGLCPFHTERTPSFYVSPVKHSYHCHGCKAGGTAARFLMEFEGLKFPEAVKRLADAAGIHVQEEALDPETERQMKHRAALRRVHADIAAWFQELLLKRPLGAPARDYLKSRGINSEVAKNWMLGYAPEKDQYFRQWAADRGYSDMLLLEAGIFKRADDGRIYSGFRNRLMFPIKSDNGEIIAFSGRLLDANPRVAKYLNSPETPIFSKGRVFFGFDKSKRYVNKLGQAIVFEGQIDLITAFEFGVQNVVAPLGTAFGDEHARMLRHHAQEVILCFDADNAGFKAVERAYNHLSPAGLVVKVASLPKGEDPDSMIRKQGVEEFKKLLDRAVDFLDYQIAHKKSQHGNDLRNQVMLTEQTAATIAMNPSVAARDLMIRSHAAQLGITEDALRKMVSTYVKRQLKAANEKQQSALAPNNGTLTPAQEAARFLQSQHTIALTLARSSLLHSEVMRWLRKQDLDAIVQDMPGVEILALVWHSHFDETSSSSRAAFIAGLDPVAESAITLLLNKSMPDVTDSRALSADLYALGTARIAHLIQRAQSEMKQVGISPQRAADLQQRVLEWRKEYLDRTRRSSDCA
ncbi:MAG: DNA primase [Verrucomicrobiaceae bacterium]|nr:DNA primase [Verrucomicrobiaceae bacterium]